MAYFNPYFSICNCIYDSSFDYFARWAIQRTERRYEPRPRRIDADRRFFRSGHYQFAATFRSGWDCYSFASITLKADQVISGTAINMLAAALTIYMARTITGSGNVRVAGIIRQDVPGLSKIPVLGPLFFSQVYWSTWLVLLILILSWILLYKTSFGLRLRACGEHPSAVASAGINVHRMRYFAVCASGALSALGGSIILVTYSGEFNGSVDGLGFLAIAALIFGQWKPFGILGATFFFGFARTVANVSQVIPALSGIPPVWLKIFPYLVTLIALVLFSKNSAAPKANGEPY